MTLHSSEISSMNCNRFLFAKCLSCKCTNNNTSSAHTGILEFITRDCGDNEGTTDLDMSSLVHSLVEPDSSLALLAEVESSGCL